MATPRPSSPGPTPSTVTLPKYWLLAMAALVTLPWLVGPGLYFGAPEPETDSPFADAPPTEARLGNGPWGHLTATPIVISPQLEYVPAEWGRNAPAEWVFPNATAEVVTAFLASSGFSPEQMAQLGPYTRREAQIAGVVITPPSALVRALTPDVHARLYTQLSRSTLNFDQAQSFRFKGRTPADWFTGTMMSAETRRLVEPLADLVPTGTAVSGEGTAAQFNGHGPTLDRVAGGSRRTRQLLGHGWPPD